MFKIDFREVISFTGSTIVSQVSSMVLGVNTAQLKMLIYVHIVQQLEHE